MGRCRPTLGPWAWAWAWACVWVTAAAPLNPGLAPQEAREAPPGIVFTASGAYRVPSEKKAPVVAHAAPATASSTLPPAEAAQTVPSGGRSAVPTPYFAARLVHIHPHDTSAFTEGLGFLEFPALYESTGLYSNMSAAGAGGGASLHRRSALRPKPSSLRRIDDFRTGRIHLHRELDARVFAEGSTVVGEHIYLSMYLSNKILVFDRRTLKPVRISLERRGLAQVKNTPDSQEPDTDFLSLPEEGPMHGWGMCTDDSGHRIIMSDGTSTLHFLDRNLKHLDSVTVRDGDTAIRDLNELEWVNGLVYANVLGSNCIAKILPDTGDVVGWLHVDVDRLWPDNPDRTSYVLNGIAYDAKRDILLVTGKMWPHIFEIKEDQLPPGVLPGRGERCQALRTDYSSVLAGYMRGMPGAVAMPMADEVRSRAKLLGLSAG